MLGPTSHVDTFTRDHLPPPEEWPEFRLEGFDYPDHLNAAVELTDAMVAKGFGDHTALIGNGRRRTYKELSDWTNRLAHALVENYGVKPGSRVLIRSANNPAMVACWLAATKAGAVVVNTMPMLRAGELTKIVDKAEVSLTLCDTRLMDEMIACAKDSRYLKQVVGFDGTATHDADLDRIAAIPALLRLAVQRPSGSRQALQQRLYGLHFDLEVDAPAPRRVERGRDPVLAAAHLFQHELRAVQIQVDETLVLPPIGDLEAAQIHPEGQAARQVAYQQFRHHAGTAKLSHRALQVFRTRMMPEPARAAASGRSASRLRRPIAPGRSAARALR
ncbi:2-succinylbenzoate--CoA ligase [compost metagenome]